MKALAILRVSTTSQQIDDQREELFAFMKSQGYDEIVPIEAVGASAIKMDDKYMELVAKVKETIMTDKSIKAACVWELSRLGRNEVILMEFKEFFISHNIQFICKNPYMKLLEDDGSVNAGMELAFSLFATMTKQEMAEKKARFKRAKKANAARGKYIGGNTRKFGYYIDENGFFQEKPEESSVVKQIFELYATGQYSTYSLSKELEERGVYVDDRRICRILQSESYTGKTINSGVFEIKYPPIISDELFEAALKIRTDNKIDMKRGERLVLGSKVVKCYQCGAVCTSNSRHYVCCKHIHKDCTNGLALRQCVADGLLWRVASILHIEYLTTLNADKEKEYRQEMAVIDQKIMAIDEKIEKTDVKRKRIVESYMEGHIDKEDRDLRLSKVKDEVEVHLKSKTSLQEKRDALEGLLEGIDKDMDYINSMVDAAFLEYTPEEKFEIIHKHILSLTAEQQSFGERDPRTTRPNGVLIIITPLHGNAWKFMYVPKFYKGHNLYVWNGKEWKGDEIEITDKAVNTKKKKGGL